MKLTDRAFLNYVRSHSQTERALFSGSDAARFLALAGYEEQARDIQPGHWQSMPLDEIREYLAMAEHNVEKVERNQCLGATVEQMCAGKAPLVEFLGALQFEQSLDDDGYLQIEVVHGRAVLCTISCEDVKRPGIGGRGAIVKVYRVWHMVSYPSTRDEPEGADDATVAEEATPEAAMAAAFAFVVREYFERLHMQRSEAEV